jgi:N-carbamoylputrescine amidase
MRSEIGCAKTNLERIQVMVETASAMGAEIICLPELCVTGYSLQDPMAAYGALSPGDAIQTLVGAARASGGVVLAGIVEPADHGLPYISQLVFGAEGLLGIYRKTHLSPPESARYQPAASLPVFSEGAVVFGVQLCYEAHFPEISTVMALKGADVLFLPHASPRGAPVEKLDSWMRHLTGRAFDNGVFVVACNQVGRNREALAFPGVAVIIGPDGRIMASYAGDEEKILYAELREEDLKRVRDHRMRYFLSRRRPELYGRLVDSTVGQETKKAHGT